MPVLQTTANGSKMATGTYTGAGGAAQSIIGIGFRPRYVLVYICPANDTDYIFFGITTDRDTAAGRAVVADGAGAGTCYSSNAIEITAAGFDAHNFASGTGNDFTTIGEEYHWVAYS